jgi:hypothetical protein
MEKKIEKEKESTKIVGSDKNHQLRNKRKVNLVLIYIFF